jgi:hypothetical protein
MDEVEVTPMEEDEVLGVVRHSFECDLGICGGRHNVNHIHSEECKASTLGHDRIDSPSGSNDGRTISLQRSVIALVADRSCLVWTGCLNIHAPFFFHMCRSLQPYNRCVFRGE